MIKKIYAMIPDELFLRLSANDKFKDDWDDWIAMIINQALDEEGCI